LCSSLPSDAVYIGVHIRRGDMAIDPKYTVADAGYFRRAVHLVMTKFPGRQLVFVVCTDDFRWSKGNFPDAVSRGMIDRGNHSDGDVTNSKRKAVVVFSRNHVDREDLAILSACNHTIMTVGTFGWWAAYLAGGLTIYYRKFPAENFELYQKFSREDHFLPEWIGL